MSVASLKISPDYKGNVAFLTTALPELQQLIDNKVAKVITSSPFGLALYEFGSKSRMTEDKNYTKNDKFWTYVRRGTGFFANQQGEIIHVNPGMFKFGYEEDSYHAPACHGVTERYTEKENGENFKVSAFSHDGVDYWVFCSKNVHAVIRRGHEMDDFATYIPANVKDDEDYRHKFAIVMGKVFMNQNYDYDKIFNHLNTTRHTLVCEACMYKSQHLVDLWHVKQNHGDEKHDDEPNQNDFKRDFIFCYSFVQYSGPENGLVIDPSVTDQVLADLGLPGVRNVDTVQIADKETRRKIREKYTRQDNSEGAVVYVSDSTGKVIHVYKLKNFEYIPDRAVREVMRRDDHCVAAINRRFDKLHCKDDIRNLPERIRLAITWYAYWIIALNAVPDVFSKWVTYKADFNKLSADEQNGYLACLRTKQPDERPENMDSDAVKANIIHVNPPAGQLRVVLIAIPGTGKTIVGNALATVYGGKYGDKDMTNTKDPKVFNKQINEMTGNANIPAVVLGKCHHDGVQRKQTLTAMAKKPGRLVYIKFYHPDGMNAMIELCLERIADRGNNHQTLTPDSANIEGIIRSFSSSYQHITNKELAGNEIILLDMTLPPAEQLKYILTCLKKDASDDVIAAALGHADAYEKSIQHVSSTQYWGVSINPVSFEKVRNHASVTELLTANNKLVFSQKLHSTMHYFGGKNAKPELESPYRALEGKSLDVKISGLYYTDRVMCAVVEKTFPCNNEFAHITLALVNGAKPVESNAIIKDYHNGNVAAVKFVPMDLTISGVVTRT
jgi:hypothetical protein